VELVRHVALRLSRRDAANNVVEKRGALVKPIFSIEVVFVVRLRGPLPYEKIEVGFIGIPFKITLKSKVIALTDKGGPTESRALKNQMGSWSQEQCYAFSEYRHVTRDAKGRRVDDNSAFEYCSVEN